MQHINFKKIFKYALPIAVIAIIIFFEFYKIGSSPNTLFCDETNIALVAHKIAMGNFSDLVNVFFYKQFDYIMFSLVPFAEVPFIAIFGVNDMAVRFSAVFYSLISLFLIYKIFRELKWNNSLLALVLFFFTPIFLHFSNIGFGHISTYAFSLAGILLLIQNESRPSFKKQAASAIFLGLSLYGQQSFTIIVPVVVFLILLLSLIRSIKLKRAFKKIIKEKFIFFIVILIFTIPMVFEASNDANFFKRYSDKSQSSVQTLSDQASRILSNIPKYFSPDYLFVKGEYGITGASVTRHSISDLGIISPLLIIMVLLALSKKKPGNNFGYFIIGIILFTLFPLPDLLTTTISQAPYTFSSGMLLYAVPLIFGYASDRLSKIKYNGIKNTILILIILVLAVYIYFVKTGIDGYGAKSSDYWGYQQGMKEIISKSSELQNSYDEIFISGYFNNADSVITFYNFDHQCTKCKLGFVDKMYDPLKNQLFIIRSAEMDVVLKLMKGHTVKQVDTIQIASGVKEFVLFTVSN